MSRDSVQGIFTVAAVLCVVCSLLVASTAEMLSDKIERNKQVDRKKNILLAANLCEKQATADQVDAIFKEKIRQDVIDIATGSSVDTGEIDPTTFVENASKDPSQSHPVTPPNALPGIRTREPYALVYRIVEEGKPSGYVLPIYGKGLWSTLKGFLALKADRETVLGVTFYEHKETPGLGGEVDNENWKAQWQDKRALDDYGVVVLQVLKGKAPTEGPEAQVSIDGLSGATITTKGVDNLIKYWLGADGFGPFLKSQENTSEGSASAFDLQGSHRHG